MRERQDFVFSRCARVNEKASLNFHFGFCWHTAHSRRCIHVSCLVFLLSFGGIGNFSRMHGQDKPTEVNRLADSVFNMKRVSKVRLKISPQEWARLQPGSDVNWDINQAFKRVVEDAEGGRDFRAAPDKRPGLAGYMGVDHQYGSADITFNGKEIKNVGVRYKGNGTFWLGHEAGKYSFKIDFGEYVEGQEFSGLKKINFNNCVTDPSMLREALSYELFRRANVPSARTGWAELEVQVGEQQPARKMGLYLVVEQVDKRFLKRVYGSSQGLLVKPSHFGTFPYLGTDWSAYESALVPKTKPRPELAERLIAFSRLLNEADDQTFESEIEHYLDMNEFLSFLAVNVLLSNLDSFLAGAQNYYAYLDPQTEKLQFLPWDLDISFGEFSMVGTAATRRNLSINHPEVGEGSNLLIERILSVPRFREAYQDRLRELLETEFSEANWIQLIRTESEFIEPYVAEQGRGAAARFQAAVGRVPSAEMPNPLEYFVEERRRSILDQLDGRSDGDRVQYNAPVLPVEFWTTLLWSLLALMIGLLLNFAAWIWGIVAGARNHWVWCLANILFYPLSLLIFGLCIDRRAGLRAAIMTLLAVFVMVAVIWGSVVSLRSFG